MTTHHVVLVTYGEPETAAFRDHLAYSWRILLGLTRTVAPIPRPLLPLIAFARARGRNVTWRNEAYASPLEPITRRQAERLASTLARLDHGCQWAVHVGYEFRHPLIADVLERLPHDDPVTVVPMYATESAFTHALSRDAVAGYLGTGRSDRSIRTLPALQIGALADVAATHVRTAIAERPEACGADVALVLAAHGTLVRPSRPIDTGLAVAEELCAALSERLTPHFGMVVNGWLNHTRGGTWSSPAIDETLRHVVGAGFRKVAYFPYGFLADNAESELEGRVALRGQPSLAAVRLPCLNDSPLLALLLARQVVEATRSTTVRFA